MLREQVSWARSPLSLSGREAPVGIYPLAAILPISKPADKKGDSLRCERGQTILLECFICSSQLQSGPLATAFGSGQGETLGLCVPLAFQHPPIPVVSQCDSLAVSALLLGFQCSSKR